MRKVLLSMLALVVMASASFAQSIEVSIDNVSASTQYGQNVTVDAVITNTGNAPLELNACVTFPDKATNSMAYAADQYNMSGLPIPTKFPLDNPSNYEQMQVETIFEMINDGEYINGHWYVVDMNSPWFYTINMETGVSAQGALHGFVNLYGIAYNPVDDQVYIKTDSDIYTVDLATGYTEYAFKTNTATTSFTITNDGRFILVNNDDNCLMEFNPETGEETVLVNFDFDINYMQGIATDRETNLVYMSAYVCEEFYICEGELFKLDLGKMTFESLGYLNTNYVGLIIPTEMRWLSLSNYSGILPAGESITVSITMDGSWAESGTFEANIAIDNNSDTPQVNIPVTFTISEETPLPGDANSDGLVDVADIYTILSYLFERTPPQFSFEKADANADGSVDVLDIMSIVNIIYSVDVYESVDLGLPSGLKWATYNVGATTPSEYGEYFAWGEIEAKSSYDEENSVTYGVEIGDISGNAQYDAARAKWGGSWRMPTKAEYDELVAECRWEWTTQDGTNGWNVTGPSGNHIFIPVAGYYYGDTLYDAGDYGCFWSSTPYEDDTYRAYGFFLFSDGYETGWDTRICGFPIRPVTE